VALSLLEIGVVGYILVSSLEWSATLEMWRDSNFQSHRGRMLWQRIGRWSTLYLLVTQQKEAYEMTPQSTSTYT